MISIQPHTSDCIESTVQLFDEYRVFYQQPSNLAAAEQFIRDRTALNDSIIYLAVVDKKTVGFLQIYPTFSSIQMGQVWLINDLFVSKSSRDSGIGSALIQHALSQAQLKQIKAVRISTENINQSAQRLYRKHDFIEDTKFIHFNFFTQ